MSDCIFLKDARCIVVPLRDKKQDWYSDIISQPGSCDCPHSADKCYGACDVWRAVADAVNAPVERLKLKITEIALGTGEGK